MMTSVKPVAFEQCIDIRRPHTLLTENTRSSGSLHYRYEDTMEEVSVPNIWYNQTYVERVAFVNWQAKLQDEAADKFAKNPQPHMSLEAVKNVVSRYREKACKFRAEAKRMEAAGSQTHPVAASHMQLDLS